MIDTHNKIITFGQYEGERWTRLPVSYLRWLANDSKDREARELAESELARRGVVLKGEVELTGHSIDRASQIIDQELYRADGLHSYLYKLATIAYTFTTHSEDKEEVEHDGLRFIFIHGHHYPILKTVIRSKKKKTHA